MVCPHAYVQQLKHRPPFAGSLPPEPHAELFHLVVAGLRSVRQAQVLVFLLDRVVSDRVHPGNGIHELPPSLSLAGSSQPGCPDGYAGPRPVAAPRSAAVMKRVLMPHCPTDSAVRWPDASCRLPRAYIALARLRAVSGRLHAVRDKMYRSRTAVYSAISLGPRVSAASSRTPGHG